MMNPLLSRLLILSLSIIVASCSTLNKRQLDKKYGIAAPQADRIVSHESPAGQFFLNTVQPIIESRCAVCHGCYDAPCQLKLTSATGIDRGANPTLIYHGSRLTADAPSRLDIDAQTTEEWRNRGFFPALNERDQTSAANLQAGLIFRMLEQKQRHPLPDGNILPTSFDLSLNRKQSCPRIEDYEKYERQKPLWGMPYALPAISTEELQILTQWLADGAKMALPAAPVVGLQSRIKQWEILLNGDSLKQQLVARYIYEHWFIADLYFEDIASDRFFHLVRSATPPGLPARIIATRRPFDNPGVERVYYRFVPVDRAQLYKTHMPYALSSQKFARINELFFNTNYDVEALPSYQAKEAANPFISFAAIPTQSRYKFMLDEANFTIMGFIKGPVCRGNIALNVINDHFWVFFVAPDSPLSQNDEFIASQVDNISFPAENEGFFQHLAYWVNYSKHETHYLNAKSEALAKRFNGTPLKLDEQLIWDGDGHNDNAALSVFRHFDSAVVLKGLVGEIPQTAWVIDYTLLERIHYLLVAGFDVFGNFNHQLLTRLHMDFLRLEGEFNFLALLPQEERLRLRDLWYRNADENVKSFLYGSRAYLNYPPGIDYKTDKPGLELIELLKQRLAPVLNQRYSLDNAAVSDAQRAALKPLVHIRGQAATIMPEATIILLKKADGQKQLFTITSDKAYSNLTSLFAEQKNRLPEEDALTVMYGVASAYPSVFLQVNEQQLAALSERIKALATEEDYTALLDDYGIRRTDPNFWQFSDAVHQQLRKIEPIAYGLLDYNRLENR